MSGVLISDGTVLVEKRRADDDADPGLILPPRGHVEVGESLKHALERDARGTRDTSRKDHTDSRPLLYGVERREAENTLSTHQGLEGENQIERSGDCLLGIRHQQSKLHYGEKDCPRTIEPSLPSLEH